ncbi:MAG TPA: MFS transporter [Xanthomonadaceae bacterium]|nr:MFS transporter [Xanthomonadaceae bacterium]
MEQHDAIGGRERGFRVSLRESPPLLWSFLYFFFLLTGYYVLRPVRDALGASSDIEVVFPRFALDFAEGHGIALGELTLQLMFTATFVSMLLLQPVYGWLVARYRRRVFLPAVYTVFIACLLGFYFVFDVGLAGRGFVFFVWVAVFNLFAVSVFWSFMSDIYLDSEARRYYGYIAAGGTLGGLAGPLITRLLVERIGVANLLLVSALLLGLCIVCILRLRRWAREREAQRRDLWRGRAMGGTVLAGLRLTARDPLLRAMVLLMFFGVGVGTLLYNEQREIALRWFDDAEARTAYYSMIDLAINFLTLTVQLLFTRALLSRYGVAPLLMIPVVAVTLGFALLTASPLPLLVAGVQVVTRAGNFSLVQPARESVFTRVDRESRYKAKAFIDTAVYRGGDLSFVWLHKLLAGFGSAAVFGAGVLVALAMSFSAWRVVQLQRGRADAREQAATAPAR